MIEATVSRRGVVAAAAFGLIGGALPGRAATIASPAVGHVRQVDPALSDAIDPSAEVTLVTQGFTWTEGPLWLPDRHMLIFSDPPQNAIYRWSEKEGLGRLMQPSGWEGAPDSALREPGSNGLALDERGRVVMADSGGRGLARLNLDTHTKTVLTGRFGGKRYNSPNDLIVASDGAIYFTDPPYGLVDGDRSPVKEQPANGVYRLSPAGEVTLVDASLSLPNGVALSPDERTLYVSVSDPQAPRIYAYPLDRAGKAGERRVFFDTSPLMGDGVKGLPDGMTADAHGRIFAGGPGGLLIISPAGTLLGVIEVDGRPVSNCVFGNGGKTLYMTAGDAIVRVKTRTRGL